VTDPTPLLPLDLAALTAAAEPLERQGFASWRIHGVCDGTGNTRWYAILSRRPWSENSPMHDLGRELWGSGATAGEAVAAALGVVGEKT
jgi:hypothetical protein